MTRRRKRRGIRLPALFTWTAEGDTAADAPIGDNPLTRPCPHCHAGVGQQCTWPGRRGSRNAKHGYHDSRKET